MAIERIADTGVNDVYKTLCQKILTFEGRVLVGIDGKDASGKTRFADGFATYLAAHTERQVMRVSLDDFFNPRRIRKQNPDEPRGCYEDTFDYSAIRNKLLVPFKSKGEYVEKTFDYNLDAYVKAEEKCATPETILVIDGVFLQRAEMVDFWDVVVLLRVEGDVAIERGTRRDAERIGDYGSARKKFTERYIASQKLYYDECHPEEKADIVVDNTDFLNPRIVKVQDD